jgi:hypothetical protein
LAYQGDVLHFLKRKLVATNSSHTRRLGFESLEKRQMLSVTVDTLVDEADGSIVDGDVSLRDAIANATAGETINFAGQLDGGTITLDNLLGELEISRDLAIDASSLPSLLTVDLGMAQTTHRVQAMVCGSSTSTMTMSSMILLWKSVV